MIDNPFEMVVLIVLITAVAGVLRAKYRRTSTEGDPAERVEAERLRSEVKTLKDRLAVIERITVEKENSLERQIDALRDRQ